MHRRVLSGSRHSGGDAGRRRAAPGPPADRDRVGVTTASRGYRRPGRRRARRPSRRRPVTTVTIEPPVDVLVDRSDPHGRRPAHPARPGPSCADVVRVAGRLAGDGLGRHRRHRVADRPAAHAPRALSPVSTGTPCASGGGRLAYRLGDELDRGRPDRGRSPGRDRPHRGRRTLSGPSCSVATSCSGVLHHRRRSWRTSTPGPGPTGRTCPTPVSHVHRRCAAGRVRAGRHGAQRRLPVPGHVRPVSLRPTRQRLRAGRPGRATADHLAGRPVDAGPPHPGRARNQGRVATRSAWSTWPRSSTAPAVAASWPEDPRLAVDTQACVWTDVATVLCGADRGLVRLRADRPGPAEYIQLVQRGSDRSVPGRSRSWICVDRLTTLSTPARASRPAPGGRSRRCRGECR